MLDNNVNNNEIELVKLISFAYDLYEDEMNYYNYDCILFPRLYTYNHDSYDTKRLKDGIVFGKRGYASHSESTVFTNLGLSVGKINNNKLDFKYAITFGIDNERKYIRTSLLKYSGNETYKPKLEYCFGAWENLNDEDRKNLFIKSMTILGYKKKDVESVINGNMSARQAYINIAPKNKKYKQWVNKYRQHFQFENNIAISGHYSTIYDFDKFPFPFEGEVIIDCKKANTSGIKLNNNTRKVKLINVNENQDSIKYSNLRNATIEEVIDLSKVDATWTKFGHQKLINLENSIAPLEDMDLTLACDINGNRFKISKDGKVDSNSLQEKDNCKLSILANVDTKEMTIEALNNNCDGVGLVRTESMFYSNEKIKKYISLFLDCYESKDILNDFKQEQMNLLDYIIKNFKNKKVAIRLFDFRYNELFDHIKITKNELYNMDYDDDIKRISESRGAQYLAIENEILLKLQIESILEVCSKYNKEIDILVPYIEDEKYLEKIKSFISNLNVSYNAKYRIGAMIENKISSHNADNISKIVDFISIGLNDLTESVTGKSRDSMNNEFYYLNNEVKDIVKETVYRSRAIKEDIEICICGEHTNYLENLDFLSSIGINSISVNPYNVYSLKESLNTKENKYNLTKNKKTSN